MRASKQEKHRIFSFQTKNDMVVSGILSQCIYCAISLLMIHVMFVQSQCPDLYRRYSAKHTFCQPPNNQCNILARTVSKEDAKTIVQAHNEYRSKIAMGKETTGNLPSSADMLQMEWDDELAAVAEKHAENCKFEHDCNECRQISKFNVGQNLYTSWRCSNDIPQPDWKAAVKSWYDEVADFNKNIVGSFNPAGGTGVIGHFTQVIWAQTWKVGCGYVAYKEGEKMNQMYTCNYGPGGNMYEAPVYTSGKPCSLCPVNSCCGKNCNTQPEYDGLCKMNGNEAPKYPRTGSYEYYCDFTNPAICLYETPAGMKQWTVYNTLSGSYIGIILEGGETSTLNFRTPFKGKDPSCFSVSYRKGPNVAGEVGSSELKEHFENIQDSYGYDVPLSQDTTQFMSFGMNLNWNADFTVSINFSVPPGATAQYVELKNVFLKRGPC
uniref:Venom allergen/CRISP n=1 Tax=Periegops suteri TaxID=440353 RepID=A0A6B9KE58_9ARAC|nr:venom allergen/CRISP [Periegops suteri]